MDNNLEQFFESDKDREIRHNNEKFTEVDDILSNFDNNNVNDAVVPSAPPHSNFSIESKEDDEHKPSKPTSDELVELIFNDEVATQSSSEQSHNESLSEVSLDEDEHNEYVKLVKESKKKWNILKNMYSKTDEAFLWEIFCEYDHDIRNTVEFLSPDYIGDVIRQPLPQPLPQPQPLSQPLSQPNLRVDPNRRSNMSENFGLSPIRRFDDETMMSKIKKFIINKKNAATDKFQELRNRFNNYDEIERDTSSNELLRNNLNYVE